MIVVDGFNISSAVRATNDNLSGVKLRNIQVSILFLQTMTKLMVD
jgi:hypothetical protein